MLAQLTTFEFIKTLKNIVRLKKSVKYRQIPKNITADRERAFLSVCGISVNKLWLICESYWCPLPCGLLYRSLQFNNKKCTCSA